MKVRIENERIPRGVESVRHLKLGPGGLSDIEWLAQYLQLISAKENVNLQTASTLEALTAASTAGLLTETDSQVLQEAWILASNLRDANFLGTGRGQASKVDVIPLDVNEFAAVAAIIGYSRERRKDLYDDYLRLARKSREIMVRVFYGDN
ncbi:hypothetical protein RQN30_00205 [Arcanobacterium hippocoleae]